MTPHEQTVSRQSRSGLGHRVGALRVRGLNSDAMLAVCHGVASAFQLTRTVWIEALHRGQRLTKVGAFSHLRNVKTSQISQTAPEWSHCHHFEVV